MLLENVAERPVASVRYTFLQRDAEQSTVHEAWIQLACPNCERVWEAKPTDLPPPVAQFRCPYCATEQKTDEFMKTTRDLEILETFHES